MDIFLEALLIFALRVVGITVSTIGTLTTVQGRKLFAAATGSLSALVYIIAAGKVVANLSNVWNILAYCGGFAVGTLVGMILEQRLAWALPRYGLSPPKRAMRWRRRCGWRGSA